MRAVRIHDPRGGDVVARQRDDESEWEFDMRAVKIDATLFYARWASEDVPRYDGGAVSWSLTDAEWGHVAIQWFAAAERLLNQGREGGRP